MKISAQKEETIKELQSALQDRELPKTEYVRVQAVLLRKKGYQRKVIADMVGKSIHAIEDWVVAYNHQGLTGLRTRPTSRPSRAKLTPTQRTHLQLWLKKQPVRVGIGEESYWTMGAVKQLVKRETGVVYKSVNAYRKLLAEAGLSYQKVEFVDKHQNQEGHDGFKKQLEAKIKGGRISMWW